MPIYTPSIQQVRPDATHRPHPPDGELRVRAQRRRLPRVRDRRRPRADPDRCRRQRRPVPAARQRRGRRSGSRTASPRAAHPHAPATPAASQDCTQQQKRAASAPSARMPAPRRRARSPGTHIELGLDLFGLETAPCFRPSVDSVLSDGQELAIGDVRLRVIVVPDSPGCTCFFGEIDGPARAVRRRPGIHQRLDARDLAGIVACRVPVRRPAARQRRLDAARRSAAHRSRPGRLPRPVAASQSARTPLKRTVVVARSRAPTERLTKAGARQRSRTTVQAGEADVLGTSQPALPRTGEELHSSPPP